MVLLKLLLDVLLVSLVLYILVLHILLLMLLLPLVIKILLLIHSSDVMVILKITCLLDIVLHMLILH